MRCCNVRTFREKLCLAKQSANVHLFPSDLQVAKDYSTRLVTWLDTYNAEHELGMHIIDLVAIPMSLC